MRWLVLLGMLGIVLLLAACDDGESTNLTIISTPSLPSTIKLTVSGGVSGTYTIISQNFRLSQYHPDQYWRALTIDVADSAWEIIIAMPGSHYGVGNPPLFYRGPATYALSAGHGEVSFASADHTKIWDFATGATSASCAVTIDSDTSWNSQSSSATTELKGVFSCSQLNSDGPSLEPPITISKGQFDVVAENISG